MVEEEMQIRTWRKKWKNNIILEVSEIAMSAALWTDAVASADTVASEYDFDSFFICLLLGFCINYFLLCTS